MKKLFGTGFPLTLVFTLTACQGTQKNPPPAVQPAPETAPPLVLTATVPLGGVKGRFDHFDSGEGKVFLPGLGNNSVEVIDILQGTLMHTITGVPNPRGVAFPPEANKLFVASEKGNEGLAANVAKAG